MAPQEGLEPTTLRLTAECSAIELLRNKFRRRPTLPGRVQPSTIGAEGLNFCVRNGNRWDPFAIATGNCFVFRLDSQTLAQHVISCRLESPLRASRVYTLFHPVPLANLHNCTSYSEFSSHSWPQSKRSFRPISSSNLHALPRSQRCPIYLLVFQGSIWNLSLVVSFTLRCFQRLSRPYFASQLCPWQDNCCTSGTSIPVLSY